MHEKLNESPVDVASDYGEQDWKYNKRRGYKRRHKRDILSSGKSRSKKSFNNPVEDNEDLLNFNSGASIYIPTTVDRLNLGLADNTAIHNHKLSINNLPKTNLKNSKRSNHFPSYGGHSINTLNNVPFIGSSSFDFSKIPIVHNVPTTNNRPKIGPNFSNLYPIYDTNLDTQANEPNDYLDFSNDKREEIDLDYKEKAGREPEYFDDEFTNEFKDNFDFPKPTQRPKITKKSYNPKRNNRPKSKKTTFKKKYDYDKLEREDDLEARTVDRSLDSKGQKLVRVTRQITVYNKNLFEDSFNLRGVDEEEMLDSNDALNDESISTKLDQESDEKRKELKKPNLSKLKRRRKIRKKKTKKSKTNSNKQKKRSKNGLKSPAYRGKERSRRGGKGNKMKSKKSMNLISSSLERNNSSIYTDENSWYI